MLNEMIESLIQVACLKTASIHDLPTEERLAQIDHIVLATKRDILRAISSSGKTSTHSSATNGSVPSPVPQVVRQEL